MTFRWKERRSGTVAVTALVVGAMLLPTAAANAAPADNDVDALLSVVETTSSSVEDVSVGDTMAFDETAGAVQILLAEDSGSSVFVEREPERERGAGPTIYSVIESHGETAQTFDFTVDGQPAVLESTAIGASEFIVVKSAVTGEVVNVVLPAWAEDANGDDIATNYEIDDGSLTQHVDTEGAAFPVVADPALACNFVHCTIQFNKYETRQVGLYGAAGAALFTAACGLAGSVVAGAICAAYGAWHVGVANDARGQGKCYGQQFLIAAGALVYPVIYSGGNCR